MKSITTSAPTFFWYFVSVWASVRWDVLNTAQPKLLLTTFFGSSSYMFAWAKKYGWNTSLQDLFIMTLSSVSYQKSEIINELIKYFWFFPGYVTHARKKRIENMANFYFNTFQLNSTNWQVLCDVHGKNDPIHSGKLDVNFLPNWLSISWQKISSHYRVIFFRSVTSNKSEK